MTMTIGQFKRLIFDIQTHDPEEDDPIVCEDTELLRRATCLAAHVDKWSADRQAAGVCEALGLKHSHHAHHVRAVRQVMELETHDYR